MVPITDEVLALLEQLTTWLDAHPVTAAFLSLVPIVAGCYVAYLLVKAVVSTIVHRVVDKSAASWDDVFRDNKVFVRLSQLVPAGIAYYGARLNPYLPDAVVAVIQRLAAGALVAVLIFTVNAVLRSLNQIYDRLPSAKMRPIKGYIQIVQIFLFTIGAILFVAALLGESPWLFMSGIGAMTAVLLLVFKDTILSLVASVQLTSNDMIRLGDWVEVPNQNADGEVVDIALHTVKVENWDKTITTIPTYTLISQGFKNWRTMPLSGGRRIKRALFIDMTTIRHLTDEEVDRFETFALLKDYMARKRREIAAANSMLGNTYGANGRRLTNVGTFRAYIEAYLRNHPGINQDMTLIVRQLAPTPTGLPIEIYAFTNQTAWVSYEGIQSDVFDHVLAVAPEFGVQIYQQPAGSDFRSLAAQAV